MERLSQFHEPVMGTFARREGTLLTNEQFAFYRESGYVKYERVLDKNQIAALLARPELRGLRPALPPRVPGAARRARRVSVVMRGSTLTEVE